MRRDGQGDFPILEREPSDGSLRILRGQDEYFPVAFTIPVIDLFPVGLDLFSDEGMRSSVVIAKWNSQPISADLIKSPGADTYSYE